MAPENRTSHRQTKMAAFGSVLLMVLSLLSVSALVIAPAASAAPGPVSPRNGDNVTAEALPTTQIDGVAWTQLVLGNRVYVGGKFDTARPAGAAAGVSTSARKNILAYDITTGNLVTSFAPSLNSQAFVITPSPDGTKIYVGGDFTSASGASRSRIAAFNATTGALISTFAPVLNGRVRAIVADGDKVYVGGQFTTANGVARDRLAAFNAADGSLTGWNPGADAQVYTLLMAPAKDKIFVGGSFQNAGGAASYGMAALDLTTGAKLPWNATNLIRNAGDNAAILQLTTDGTAVYGNGFVFGAGGNLEGIFSADPVSGNINWVEDCHGDTYSNYPASSGIVYASSHSHYCGNVGGFPQTEPWTMYYGTAFTKKVTGTLSADPFGYYNFAGTPSPSIVNWFPLLTQGTFTGQGQAGWSVTGNDQYVVMGGEFPKAGGKAQQGLVRFAVPSVAPKGSGPEANANLKPKLNSLAANTVRVSWQTTWDRDDLNLKYQVVRDGKTATPVYETTADATFWNKPFLSFTDTNLVAGRTYSYRIYAIDSTGNSLPSPSATVVVASTGTIGTYAQAILDSSPSTYWRFDETDPASSSTVDWAGSNDGLIGTGVTRNLESAVGDTNPSFGFNGNADSSVATPVATVAPDNYSAEMWIKTTTTSGGKISGFGNAQTGSSSSYDRHVFMDKDGKIWFGVYPGGIRTLTSPASYNDGQWHQIVTSLGAAGMVLYVDGKKVASRTDVTNGQGYSGYWRVGGDNLNGWPGTRDTTYFNGLVDDVSLYSSTMTAAQVNAHYVASGRQSSVTPSPADAYGAAVYSGQPSLYWRLGESSGTTLTDSSASESPGSLGGTFARGAGGALSGNPNTATTFSGNASGWSNQQFSNPTTYSTEAWFKTTTTSGGKIIGFGSRQSALSDHYDRHVYMQDDGRLVFGTYTGVTNVITTTKSYNDGGWHYAVATQSGDGMKLYVDGVLVGTNPQTAAENFDGYWKIGGDPTWGSSSSYLSGSIDEVAVYPTALTSAQIVDHFQRAGGQLPNVLPTAEFSATPQNLTVQFDASQSSDTDGSIASYAWNFGDNQAGTGKTAQHAYAAAGTYSVTLTVTDDRGGVTTKSHDVVVTAPPANVAPVAAFNLTKNGLKVDVDGSASTDSDGTVVSYSWNFGDGTAVMSGGQQSHTYAQSGTYDIKLTVKDDDNATNELVQQVTVEPLNQTPVPSFQTSATNLQLSVDASASADPDGSVAKYEWTFGDGGTAQGVQATHVYASGGTYNVTLKVTDNKGATATVDQDVMVAPAMVNQAPVADFSGVVTDLKVAVNGTASTDPDGTIASYDWQFGTTGSGQGSTAQYTFPAAGTYPVTLTVEDDKGATSSKTVEFTVTDPPAVVPFVRDQFARTVSSGWGSADLGGTWSTVGAGADLSVSNGAGVLRLPTAPSQTGAYLATTLNTSSDTTVRISADKNGSGAGTYVSVIGRRVNGTAQYRARVRYAAANRLGVSITALKGSATEVQVVPEVLLPGSVTVGTEFNVRFQVSGTSPTELKTKVWAAGTAEPSAWLLTATDTTAGLQSAGAVGVLAYLSGQATNAPVSVSFRDLSVKPVN